uniref:WPP domain-associated protein n=1 Tax=Nelumbo nucifera TaxID=4432 RepID=A0A822YJV8_NELNU|nr:TPA_asm: hypothetical protein HUJ06_011254 [Nelumbo nucifera]
MEEFFDGLGCRLRVLGMVADSIMIGIVNSAMEEAFERVCSKEGDIERLNEKSRFCILAIMQLEWCLKFVQEETDSYVVESSYEREKLVSDLTETRDRIQRRLEETEIAILKKDRELTERLENELKLRQALELKDMELHSLRSSLKLERTMSEEVQEFILSNRVNGDESGRDGDFCELKNSVDQQFWNIKQKLEDERINLTAGMRMISHIPSNNVDCKPDSELLGEERNWVCHKKETELYDNNKSCEFDAPSCSLRPELNAGFEKMGSDIDILKETLDIAFGMMGNAISLSEVRPMEQQWRWSIEKDIIAVVFRSFLKDIEENANLNRIEENKLAPLGFWGESHSEIVNEITILRNELEQLVTNNMVQLKPVTVVASPSQIDKGHKVIPENINLISEGDHVPPALPKSGKSNRSSKKKVIPENTNSLKENSIAEGDNVPYAVPKSGKSNRSSQKKVIPENANCLEENLISEGEHSPNALPKSGNHSSQNIEKLEHLEEQPKEGSTGQQSLVAEMTKIHESIIRQKSEELNWLKAEILREKRSSSVKEKDYDNPKKRIIDVIRRLDNIIKGNENLSECCDDRRCIHWDKLSLGNSSMRFELENKRLQQEGEELNLQFMIMEEISFLLFRGLVNELLYESYNYDSEILIREEICEIVFKEKVEEWNDYIESYNIESHIAEDIYQIAFREVVKNFDGNHCLNIIEYQEIRNEENILKDSSSSQELLNLQALIRDDVYAIFLQETVKEWIKTTGNYDLEGHIIRGQKHSCNHGFNITECYEDHLPYVNKLFQNLENLISEDVCTVFIRNMVKEWNKEMESFYIERNIREEIYWILFIEIVKDTTDVANSNLIECQPSISEAMKDVNICLKECQNAEDQDNFQEYFPFTDKLSQNLELGEQNIQHEEILIKRESGLGSPIHKIDVSSKKPIMSKVGNKKLGSNLGIEFGELEEVKDHNSATGGVKQDKNHFPWLLKKKNEELQLKGLGSMFTPLILFPKLIWDFEKKVNESMRLNVLRYFFSYILS